MPMKEDKEMKGSFEEVSEKAVVIQFMHPGGEATTEGWRGNKKRHARRFVLARGRIPDGQGGWKSVPVTAWVEWEANAKLYEFTKS